MKRPLSDGDTVAGHTDSAASIAKDANKKIKQEEKVDIEQEMSKAAESVLMDENLLYEVLRRVDDGRTLAKAACVSRQWKQTAHDERIWELICTRHYHSSPMQLRAVVSRLGGFRRLFSSHLWPLLKPSSSTPPTVSSWPCLPPAPAPGAAKTKARWGKDEVQAQINDYWATNGTSPGRPKFRVMSCFKAMLLAEGSKRGCCGSGEACLCFVERREGVVEVDVTETLAVLRGLSLAFEQGGAESHSRIEFTSCH